MLHADLAEFPHLREVRLEPARQFVEVGRRQGVAVVGAVPEGRPDLEGVWNFSSLTPVERPAEFAGKATLTAAEAAKYANDARERNNADRRDGSVDADLARELASIHARHVNVRKNGRVSSIGGRPRFQRLDAIVGRLGCDAE